LKILDNLASFGIFAVIPIYRMALFLRFQLVVELREVPDQENRFA